MVLPSAILLPLYIYPSTVLQPHPWTTLYNTLAAKQDVQYDIIINPDSGPMLVDPGNVLMSDFVPAVAKLRTYENVNLLGYVHTNWADTSLQTALLSNISHYESWASYAAADISLDGIFFDEFPTVYSDTSYSNLKTASNLARSSDLGKVVFNPGAIPDPRYFALADNVVVFEGAYSVYATDLSAIAALSQATRSNSSVIIYDFSLAEADQEKFVNDLVAMDIGGLDITTLDNYNHWSALWDPLTEQVADAVEQG